MRWLLGGAIASLVIFGTFASTKTLTDVFLLPPARTPSNPTLLFVGDIMLGRAVEGLMEEKGQDYPFRELRVRLRIPDLTVGNFEGVVSKEHVHAPGMTFRFSIREEYLHELKRVGFDVLSLANNHSLDYGEDDLGHTMEICERIGMECRGAPEGVGDHSTLIRNVEGESVGFLFLSNIWNELPLPDIASTTEILAQRSTFQVAYIHWGNEYELVHSAEQGALARFLIDSGIDVVIGHHPHVVQDVEIYEGKPIFYSLGNFIFDQYFSKDVEEGLMVHLTLEDREARYRLMPIQSRESQPRTMAKDEREALFERILGGLAGDDHVDIERGTVKVPRELELQYLETRL